LLDLDYGINVLCQTLGVIHEYWEGTTPIENDFRGVASGDKMI